MDTSYLTASEPRRPVSRQAPVPTPMRGACRSLYGDAACEPPSISDETHSNTTYSQIEISAVTADGKRFVVNGQRSLEF
jgi:hypothetical protein